MNQKTLPDIPPSQTREGEALEQEARRLLDFKAENVHAGDLTPCPHCGARVPIESVECVQCDKDISDHVKIVKDYMERLDAVSNRLYELNDAQAEENGPETPSRWTRVKSSMPTPRMREHLSTVIPAFLLFFSLIVVLRVTSHGALFWAVAIAGGAVGHMMLRKSRIKKRVGVDLYRSILVIGVMLALTTALVQPMPFWPADEVTALTVASEVANLRQAPSTNADIIMKLERGAALTVVSRVGAWYEVTTADDKPGWVYSGLVIEQRD